MKKFMLIVVIMLLASTSGATEAGETSAQIDSEMIKLLALNPDQAVAYSAIMEKQRKLFLALKEKEWQQELAFYRETYALLKPVLNHKQHTSFVAIIDSVIEDTEDQELLVMGD